MNPLYVVLELGATTFFVIAAVFALRRGRLPFLELISAAAFGILLEEGDQLIFETYHYSPDWLLAKSITFSRPVVFHYAATAPGTPPRGPPPRPGPGSRRPGRRGRRVARPPRARPAAGRRGPPRRGRRS